MARARIERGSTPRQEAPPVPWAEKVVTGTFTNSGNPIFHWEIEVNSIEDLAKIDKDGDGLVVRFREDGTVAYITIYDDYLET